MAHDLLALVQWTGDGTPGNPYRPDLDGLPVLAYEDVTGTPSDRLPALTENVSVARLTVADAAAAALLDADPRVRVLRRRQTDDQTGAVTGDDGDDPPTTAERNRIGTWLQAQGFTPAQVGQLAGLSRRQVAEAIARRQRQ